MILNRQRAVRIARPPLERFLQSVKKELELGKKEATICFVSDAEIARMNRSFRKKKGPTDVLSFSAKGKKRETASTENAASTGKRDSYLGDIAIAPETARRYAKKNGRSLNDELRVLILHGVLHLLGFDHETDHGQMDRIEKKLRRRFGLA